MKRLLRLKLPFLFLAATIWLTSCSDKCEVTRTYRTTVPVTWTVESIRAGIRVLPPRELEKPAKIYTKDNYLFISEAKKGIHIINNNNPSNPVKVSFIEIPGVIDMAIRNNTLYADSYMDLVAIDIKNPLAVKEVGRVKNIFQYGLFEGISWYYDTFSRIVTDYEWKNVTETIETDCGANTTTWPIYYRGGIAEDASFNSSGPSGATGAKDGSTSGTGGSTTRFTIYDNYLYTVSQSSLTLFNIEKEEKPDSTTTINLGWGIETIFPYKDKLFIGSNTGMHIYDNADPKNPVRLSIFQHARACDPVVVENDIAFVTLREGWCGAAPNQLDVVDVKDLLRPQLLKSYPMQNPHGLGVDLPNLFICEGKYGLKSFDASNVNDIQLKQHIENIHAYDVIPLNKKLLLMIGEDGLYQYDYTDSKNLKQLSVISVVSK